MEKYPNWAGEQEAGRVKGSGTYVGFKESGQSGKGVSEFGSMNGGNIKAKLIKIIKAPIKTEPNNVT